MDNSHVALVSVKLRADGFKKYRSVSPRCCNRSIPFYNTVFL